MHLFPAMLCFSTPEWPQFRGPASTGVTADDPAPSPAVGVLLAELAARQVPIHGAHSPMSLLLALPCFSTPEWPQFCGPASTGVTADAPTPSPTVSVLLAELAARQVPIRQLSGVN